MNSTLFAQLEQRDGLLKTTWKNKEMFLHEDHRWVLPIVFDAQARRLLPKPCTLILYDAHSDAVVPPKLAEITKLASGGVSEAIVLQVCETLLRVDDSDWIVAGMELGLFDHAAVFGVEHNQWSEKDESFTDSSGVNHHLLLHSVTPGQMLGHQGDLCDLAKQEELQVLWDVLSWEPRNGMFDFKKDAPPMLLDIDLDCFTAMHRGSHFSWPDIIFQDEFEKVSDHYATTGWSGKKFFEALCARAGIIAICREAGCCGGEAISEENLRKVSQHLFGEGEPLFR